MKKVLLIVPKLILVWMLFATSAMAQNTRPTIGIASGSTGGTYWPMVEDIRAVCTTSTMQINNVVSDGSIDNIFKIYGDKSVQYGVVQEDALVYQQGLDAKMMSRIMMVFPFYAEEIHLIAREDSPIKNLADLQGMRVIEGPASSGTWVTTQVIKSLSGVSWAPLHLSSSDGLKAVQAGQADAAFIVAGSPVAMLTEATGIKLVPVSHPKLDVFAFYTKAMLPTGSYPFQKKAIGTYKINNVLATFAFKNQYHAEVTTLVSCIAKNLGELQSNPSYHVKWRDVDPLDIERIQWPAHPTAKRAIKEAAKKKVDE